MNRSLFTLRAIALVVLTLAIASVAQAQATRTWVSGVGDDVNPCSRTAPCKTFAGAISKTAAGGEIDALDPGGFGSVTITKSMTIDGNGTLASILASGTNGVNVNDSLTGTPNTIIVRLRNLTINGGNTGFDGIRFVSGRHLYVENCIVANFRGNGTNSDGLDIAPSTGSNFNIHVKDTIFSNNSGDGIRQTAPVGVLNASYDNVVLSGNNNGLEASGGTGSLSHSMVDNSTVNGVTASGGAVINVSDSSVCNGGTGITSNLGSTVRISNTYVSRNTNGLVNNGVMQSFLDNEVIGNGTDVGGANVITSVTVTNLK
jgi:hypothetical protein